MSIQSTGASRDPGVGGKPLAVSVKRTCELLSIGNTKCWELIGNGKLRTTSIGRKRLVIYSSIETIIQTGAA